MCIRDRGKTRKGLNLRAVGESPATADAAGINVTAYKYLATCVGAVSYTHLDVYKRQLHIRF